MCCTFNTHLSVQSLVDSVYKEEKHPFVHGLTKSTNGVGHLLKKQR